MGWYYVLGMDTGVSLGVEAHSGGFQENIGRCEVTWTSEQKDEVT